ncbi:L-alanine exporter AlaE [Endozoicomonas sp. OPT23]|uniref:L-alanine exporter AlaE n=1 Tax=Endozoicomonas sp. OPT23 TaxID=2072845 RepID=UPI00129B08C5|nr:L-alanine exporter AlaE [Endozoicomonas sp. OPT23]MRI34721.1 L-alanine exporter AlaE [Endozoicomonas sp. OPT23]
MSIKRETLADTFAMISFAFIIGMMVEVFVAGLSFHQSLQSRLLSIPVNLITARPYGIYRDWLMAFSQCFPNKFLGETLMDILAFISFQLPLYAALIASTGASKEQIITACIGQIGSMVVMARPFGMYIQTCRNWFVPASVSVA